MSKKQTRVVTFPQAAKAKGGCPICHRPTVAAYRPFCSRRCADIDLGRWFQGSYRVPTEETPSQGEAGENPEDED